MCAGANNPIPVNIRQYTTSLAGNRDPVTENNFWNSDLDSIKTAVARNMAANPQSTSGTIGYGDYNTKPDTFSDWRGSGDGDSIGPLNALYQSIMSPAFRMETTLGMANYNTDPNGNVIVSDKYDFNASKKGMENYKNQHGGAMGALLTAYKQGGLEGALNAGGNMFIGTEGEGAPVRINLGPLTNIKNQAR